VAVLVHADHALAKRIEATEAAVSRIFGGSVAEFMEFAGGVAVFAGVGSPVTHAMGTGMAGPVSAAEIERMEEFYRSRGSYAEIDLCPLCDPEYLAALSARGYRVVEVTNQMVRTLDRAPAPDPRVEKAEPEVYAAVALEGFFGADPPEALKPIGRAMTNPPLDSFICRIGGEPAAGGGFGMHEGMGFLFGDATLDRFRGRGLQFALIEARMAAAFAQDCDMAYASVGTGTQSQRNYERCGFQVAYTRIGLRREL
jgi:GNAT superfamily N-acetyltransferase